MAVVPERAAGLFEVVEVPAERSVSGSAAAGAAAEHEAIAVLLSRGHKVAVPVVDDDGVDLVVDYGTKVQVKFTSSVQPGAGHPILHVARHVRRHRGQPSYFRTLGVHVDVVLARVAGVGWWVLPRVVIGERRNVSLGPSMDQWREAWSVFD